MIFSRLYGMIIRKDTRCSRAVMEVSGRMILFRNRELFSVN